jgi:SP family general alpha glucoside:H+ symporter-like MFS transporter
MDDSKVPEDIAPAGDQVRSGKTHNAIFDNARSATAKEQSMTLWQGIRLYPKAVGWSILISTCICMEGYDLCLLSNFYGEYYPEPEISQLIESRLSPVQ